MVREALILGDVTHVREVQTIRTIPTDDWLALMEKRPQITMGTLPSTAVFLHWNQSNYPQTFVHLICEEPPGLKNLRMRNHRFLLSLPWTYFSYTFSMNQDPLGTGLVMPRWTQGASRVFWAIERATRLDSVLHTALIANCDGDGYICYGSTGVDANLSLGPRADRLTREFYHTTFMHDSGTGTPWQSETGIPNWRRWHEESHDDPVAYRRFPEWNLPDQPMGEGGMRPITIEAILQNEMNMNSPTGTRQEHQFVNALDGEVVIPPPPPERFTFRRAEEWLQQPGITAVDRYRFFTALQNLQADTPTFMEEPPVIDENTGNQAEDGGMPLNANDVRV